MEAIIEQYNPSMRIIDLTVGQLVELIEGINERSRARFCRPDEQDNRYAYGLSGIAAIIGCSRGTVCRLKKEGVLDDAIYQCGHLIVADKEKLLECFKAYQQKQENQ